MSYVEIGVEVWGLIGGCLVDFIIVGLLYFSCVLLVMFMGSSMRDFFSDLVVLLL